ncbi:MAG: hypothetical protein ACXVFM_14760 [Solirubrobacteraceae bacterium]
MRLSPEACQPGGSSAVSPCARTVIGEAVGGAAWRACCGAAAVAAHPARACATTIHALRTMIIARPTRARRIGVPTRCARPQRPLARGARSTRRAS